MDHYIMLPDELSGLLSSATYRDSTKSSALCDFFEEHLADFCPYLDVYRNDTARGNIDYDSLQIEDEEVEFHDFKGTIHLTCDEEAYYGCRDADNVYDHQIDVSFSITEDGAQMILHFMDRQVRDLDEI